MEKQLVIHNRVPPICVFKANLETKHKLRIADFYAITHFYLISNMCQAAKGVFFYLTGRLHNVRMWQRRMVQELVN